MIERRRIVFGAAAAAAAASQLACGPLEKDKKMDLKAPGPTRSFAFSRYLIDLPSGLKITDECRLTLTYGLTADFVNTEVEVLASQVDVSKFKSAVAKHSYKFAQQTHSDLKVPMLALTTVISEKATLLRRFRDYSLEKSFILELFMLVGDTLVIARASAYDNVIAPVEARLTKLVSQITQPEDAARAGKGFSLGPVLIDSLQDQEQCKITLHEPTRPDVWFEITTNAIGDDPDQTLLQRGNANDAAIRALGVKWDTLRRGKLLIANMKAEEELVSYKTDEKTTYILDAETFRTLPAFNLQRLKFKLRAGTLIGGVETDSSMKKADLTALWDQAMKSVRLRPGSI